MQEMWVQSLDQEDPLEKETATHSSILAWEISWTEESGYSPWGCRVGHDCPTEHSDTHREENRSVVVMVKGGVEKVT